MSATRPATGRSAIVTWLLCALLLGAALLAVAAGPELLARLYGAPATRPVPYYALAVAGLVVVGVLLFGGSRRARRRARACCKGCGARNGARAKFCGQCAAPL